MARGDSVNEPGIGAVPAAAHGQVVVLTGPPGAGKSTVGRLLADGLNPSVHLHADDFWHYIRRGRISPYLRGAHRQNQVVMDALSQAAFAYAAGGYHVICDGIVGPWFVDLFRAAATDRAIPLHYVILRPDEPTTLHRAVNRAADALTNPGPIRSLYRQFTDIGIFEQHILDSTRLTPQATADAVL